VPTLYTIGHSNRSLDEFIAMLRAHHITYLVDVRSVPKSRHVPWFNQAVLKSALRKHKIGYTHMKALGGLRHAHKDSINQGWRNASFRGYADYMQTHQFYLALKALNQLIKTKTHVAVMCAEAVPWRCHRSLIGDAETVRRVRVQHLMSKTTLHPHELTAFAVVDRSKRPIKIYYPKAD